MTVEAANAARSRALTILIIGFAVIFMSSSIKNTFQVFFVQMAEFFGQSRGSFADAGAMFMLAFGVASPLVGGLSDRVGPKRTIQLGLILSGSAFVGCALIPSFYVFIVLYGIVAAFGLTAMTYVPMGLLVDQSFGEKRKGLAYATLTNGAAIGFAVLSPVWVYAQGLFVWQEVFIVLGILFLLPLLLLVQAYLPDDLVKGSVSASPPAPWSERLKAVRGARSFYALGIGFFGCGVTMAFIDVHMVAHLQDMKMTQAQTSIALGILGVTELAGGFLAGWACDRFPKSYVIAASYFVRALSLLSLLIFPGVVGAWLFAAMFGLSYLGTVIGTSMYTLGLFGRQLKGFAFGIIWLVHQLGAFVSTKIGADVFDWFGSYHWTILGTGLIAVFSFFVSLLLLPPNPVSVELPEPALAKAQ